MMSNDGTVMQRLSVFGGLGLFLNGQRSHLVYKFILVNY